MSIWNKKKKKKIVSVLLLTVGAGSAGCVLANRLTEDLTSTVLIVEAGGSEEENEVMHIPALPGLLQNTKQDWAFRTVPQKKSCQGLKDQVKCLTPKMIQKYLYHFSITWSGLSSTTAKVIGKWDYIFLTKMEIASRIYFERTIHMTGYVLKLDIRNITYLKYRNTQKTKNIIDC